MIDASLLLLIADEVEAYRLVATWPRIGPTVPDLAELHDVIRAVRDHPDADVEPVSGSAILRWAVASGVDWETVAHWVPILFDNEMLGPDGHVDESVLALVRNRGVAKLRGGK